MFRSLAIALLVALPAPASAKIRAVFVGVDDYLYSAPTVPGAGFSDLHGTVADVDHIKAALQSSYGLALDQPSARQCRSANKVSITLTDQCATREAMLAALDDRIEASRRGDTLIFYFAGHGGQYIDDQAFDQASGNNVTLLPADARQPGASVSADILDRELRAIVDRATAKGINFVTIIDSCHSGTIARMDVVSIEGIVRSVGPIIKARPRPVTAPPAVRAGRRAGYRVHLAASSDWEEAREIIREDFRGGVFTTALAETLTALPNASFRDIAEEVRLKVLERGHGQQTPQAEGALNASLGGTHRRATLLSATPEGGGVSIAAGRLSGVTKGSAFALFASTTDALAAKGEPLATGRIAGVDLSTATLTLDAPPPAPLPARLVARQTAHGSGDQLLLVRMNGFSDDTHRRVAEAIESLPFVRIGEPAQLLVTAFGPAAYLHTVGGVFVAEFGDPELPAFRETIREALDKVARVQALLALRTDPGTADAKFCLARGSYDVFACAAPEPLGAPPPAAGKPAQLTVVNRSDEPRYIYVLGVDSRYGITLVVPPHGGRDPAVAPRQPLQRQIVPPYGQFRFVTIATDAPIDAAAFEQEGIGDKRQSGCSASIEPARCAAASGLGDASLPKVAKWSVTANPVSVE